MSVQIALYKGNSGISRVIRFITRSEYSHAAFWLAHDDNIKFCVEAWQDGLRMVGSLSARHNPGTEVDLFNIKPKLSKKQEKKLFQLIMEDLKNPPKYDFWHVFSFLPVFRIFFKDRNGDNRYFCSEYVLQRLNDVGCMLLDEEPFKVSPESISQSPKLKKVETVIT